MLAFATTDLAGWLAVVIGLVGLGGIIFTALRFRRDDTTAVVTQQSTITAEMKTLNDELRQRVDELRHESDELRLENARLAGQIDALTEQLREYRRER